MSHKIEGYHRAKAMLPEIRRLIIGAARLMDLNRNDLADLLLIKIEKDYPHETPPKTETILKAISKARNYEQTDLDKPWSIACCTEYSSFFPPDSIPVLMNYKQWIHGLSELSKDSHDEHEEYKNLFGLSMSDISISQAIWIVRLEPLTKNVFADEMAKDENVRFGYPFFIAMVYEIVETTCEILGERFISTGLDNALAAGDLDTLARIGGLGLLAASKPTNCNYECASCKYMRIPGFTKMCMPRLKGKVTNERYDNKER